MGNTVGLFVGLPDGEVLGCEVGWDGCNVGILLGFDEGLILGCCGAVGRLDGSSITAMLGLSVGQLDGSSITAMLGLSVGRLEGSYDVT